MQLIPFVPALLAVGLSIESVVAIPTETWKRGTLIEQRDNTGCNACEAQPTTSNYLNIDVSTDTAFLADAKIAAAASNAPTPSGYAKVFTNLKAASNGYAYLGYDVLKTAANVYNPAECAAKCNSITGCLSFNICKLNSRITQDNCLTLKPDIERDPTVDACSSTCQDPPAFANVKCSYWGGALTAGSAVNDGQWRNQFHVVVAGSNGYATTKVQTAPGYDTVAVLNSSAINAPLNCNGDDTYLGYKLFTGTPFDIKLCADACTSQTAYNLAHPPATGDAKVCNFWNTYLLDKNGVSQSQYCSLYTQVWNSTFATNTGQYRDGDLYTAFDSSSPGTPECEDDTTCS